MSIADKLQTIAENEQKVYDAGHNSGYNEGYESGYSTGEQRGQIAGEENEYNRFWDAYQDNGERTDWSYAFAGTGWKPDIFKPKHNIKVKRAVSMFEGNTNIVKLADYLGDTEIDWSEAGTVQYMFRGCTKLSRINVCGGGYFAYAFYSLSALYAIEKWILTEVGTQNFTEAFTYANNLNYINEIVGTIRVNVDFHYCPLVHDSLMNIINALYDYSTDTSGKTHTLTIGSTNINKLTEEELAIAYDKGWAVN